jgi:hypothetical protein
LASSQRRKTYESWKSGNIGYIVDNQQLKGQHFQQQGGNNWQHAVVDATEEGRFYKYKLVE